MKRRKKNEKEISPAYGGGFDAWRAYMRREIEIHKL